MHVDRAPRCEFSCTPAGYEVVLNQHRSAADAGKLAECSTDSGC